MKNLILTVLTLLSGVSFAYPALNDSVTYHGKYTFADSSMTVGFIIEQKIVELNKETKKVKIEEIFMAPNGSENVETKEVDLSGLMDRAQVLEILKNCESMGGQKQKLEVAAGTFDTCYVMGEKKNEVWIGDAPFHIVKQIEFDDKGGRIEIELSLFHSAE